MKNICTTFLTLVFLLICNSALSTPITPNLGLNNNGLEVGTGKFWASIMCGGLCVEGSSQEHYLSNYDKYRLPTLSEVDHLLNHTLGLGNPDTLYDGLSRFTDVFGYVLESGHIGTRFVNLYFLGDSPGELGVMEAYFDEVNHDAYYATYSSFELVYDLDDILSLIHHTDLLNILWVRDVDESNIIFIILLGAFGILFTRNPAATLPE